VAAAPKNPDQLENDHEAEIAAGRLSPSHAAAAEFWSAASEQAGAIFAMKRYPRRCAVLI